MKLDFWDVVRVAESCPDEEIRGKTGYISGMGLEEGEAPSIGIMFYDLQMVWCVEEEHLIPLGHKDEIAAADYKKRLRDGPRLRVREDGTIAD